MNPYAAAAQIASTPQEGNPRATEAWALTEAGRRLAQAAARGDAKTMREALRLNWRLWTIFQADLTVTLEAEPGNEVVINMLTLCQFVDHHTVDTLAEPTKEKLETLINLNRQIAAGLKESLERAPAAAHQTAAPMAPPPMASSPMLENNPSVAAPHPLGTFSAFA
jgi:flagellar biosynthesis activator protein FlaF